MISSSSSSSFKFSIEIPLSNEELNSSSIFIFLENELSYNKLLISIIFSDILDIIYRIIFIYKYIISTNKIIRINKKNIITK